MNSGSFFAELKRRNVYKVAVAYIVAGWALAQGIAQVFPVFDVPNWIVRLIVVLIVVGFPLLSFSHGHLKSLPKESKARQMPTLCRHRRDQVIAPGFTSLLSVPRFRWRCSSWVATRPETEQHCRATRNRSPFCRSLA